MNNGEKMMNLFVYVKIISNYSQSILSKLQQKKLQACFNLVELLCSARLYKSIHSWHGICHILPRFTISEQKNVNNWS